LLSKLGPRVVVVDWPKPWLTAGKLVGRVGYMTEDVELWRDWGDRSEAEGLGECPEV
jgi:hypothetical protein